MPKTLLSTLPNFTLPHSRIFWMRFRSLAAAPNSRLRRRVNSRSSRIGRSGTKLALISPCRCKCANQILSPTSVLWPFRPFTCEALASVTWIDPSRMLYAGIQYDPVLSMAASVQPCSFTTQARICSRSRTNVPYIRVSTFGSSIAGPVMTVTAMIFLPTSMPAHLSLTAGIICVVSFLGLGGKNQRKNRILCLTGSMRQAGIHTRWPVPV